MRRGYRSVLEPGQPPLAGIRNDAPPSAPIKQNDFESDARLIISDRRTQLLRWHRVRAVAAIAGGMVLITDVKKKLARPFRPLIAQIVINAGCRDE